jgi:hypothetical protein
MREKGYYWVYGIKWSINKMWNIYYWCDHSFWMGDEDFSEDSFEKIDETRIVRKDENRKRKLNRIIKDE